MGCRRLTSSRVNVTAERIILDAGCVVSAPLPALSGPSACAGPPYLGRGDVPQQPRRVTVGRPRSPGRSSPSDGLYLDFVGDRRSDPPSLRGRPRGPFIHPVFALPLYAKLHVLQGHVGAGKPAGRWGLRCVCLLGSDGARASIRRAHGPWRAERRRLPGIPLPVLQDVPRALRIRIEGLANRPGSRGGILSVLRYRGAWSGNAASSSRIRFTT